MDKGILPAGFVITEAGLRHCSESTYEDLPDPKEVKLCEEWIKEFARPQEVENPRAFSYSLKHIVENWANNYIANGAFIQAAILQGYKVKPQDGINAIFNMALFLPEDNWRRVKPTGFSKWLLRQENRDDVIGDLARDAMNDETWCRNGARFYDFWAYLNRLYVDYKVLEILADAWREYTEEEPPFPTLEILSKCDNFYDSEGDTIKYGETYPEAPEGKIYIYVLFENIQNRRVMYVGQTNNPPQRLKQHILLPGTIEKVAWVGKIISDGNYPYMGIVDIVNKKDAFRMEEIYICAFRYYEDRGDGSNALLNKSLNRT
jgi:hypothetical protein